MIIVIFILVIAIILQAATSDNENFPVTSILSEKQNKQLELELLSMLDLPGRPRHSPKQKLKYSSKFLLNLYNVLSKNNIETNRIRRNTNVYHGLSEDEVNKGDVSDVIISLNSINKKSDGVGKRQKLSFYTQSIPKATGLFGAELKIYQNSKMATNTSYPMYTISVYNMASYNGAKIKKVAEEITSQDYNGWLSIDISYMFNLWLENVTTVKDLHISVKPFGVANEKEIHPASIGIIFQHEKNENEPFIVAFLKAENKVKPRIPRNVELHSQRANLFDILEKNSGCSIHSLRVSFKDLGWNDWVIAPDGYVSAYCQGSCAFPIKYPTEVTNHAIIQSLVHLKQPNKFPKPSCAPTKLNELSVIYREKENTVIKKYKNMIASSCGCQ